MQVLERDGFRCRACGRSSEQQQLEVDHWRPRALGGTDSLTNLVTLCRDCNRGKGNLFFGEYIERIVRGELGTPAGRSPVDPPLAYQVDAVGQVLEHMRRSGISSFKVEELARAIAAPGLRDRVNPLFEPLSFATTYEGFSEHMEQGAVTRQGDLYAFPPRLNSTL